MEGGSRDRTSAGSGRKRSNALSGDWPQGSSSGRKDFLRKFVDSEIFVATLEDWFSGIAGGPDTSKPAFDVPFALTELQNFDYALEGVSFRQLIRMPNALHESTSTSVSVEATAYLAIEDFLHASMKGLWETFWGEDIPMPFTVACVHSTSSKFYTAEKAIVSGKVDGLCASAVVLKSSHHHSHGKWDQILELALLRPDIATSSGTAGIGQGFSYSALGEAFFFALRVLLSRSLSRSSTIAHNSNCIYVLLVDSQQGGVVRVQGDVNKLDLDIDSVYECAAQWIKLHAHITVSTLDRIWNKMGNANWGDVGTLQVLLATFHCMMQFCGMPKRTVEELAAEHSSRLQNRRTERQLVETHANGNSMLHSQQRSATPEIVEIQEESARIEPEMLKLEKGAVLWLEDSNWQKGFEINEVLMENEIPFYCASPVEEGETMFLLYVGSSPSHLESMWEDMNLWYQVQRQAKILTQMKQRGISSKYLPYIAASGRIIHPGECSKSKSSDKCNHPWCGTPILVTSPFGETISSMIRNGSFGPDQAIRCCHDCLSALAVTSTAGIRHGDIRPENVIHVTIGVNRPYFVLVGWGHAVLEDRDRPSTNLFFSSTYALQEGKLCAASDAESLIYLLYFACGGAFPEVDSVEGVLQWREISWSKRVIQQKLGDISAVLKALADYVDSLCGTPYPIDYEIWLRRLRRITNEEDSWQGN